MEQQNSSIVKETPAQAKKRQREIQKQKGAGIYVPSLLEKAKDRLRAMDQPSIESLIVEEPFKEGFDKDTEQKLKVFIQNIRSKIKKNIMNDEQTKMQDEEMKETVKQFVNKKIDKLHQAILTQQTEEERAAVILEAIDKNLFDFLEYMDNYPVPSADFLRIIIGLQDKLDEDSFTSLFVRVCSKNGGDALAVSASMVQKGIKFLAESEINQQAAYGLLRLIFINQISLSKFDVDLLTSFEKLYNHAIIRFYKSIGIKDDEIIPLLPATCFIFTTPMLAALKQGGSSLHYRLPPTLLPYLFEIISYSFCEDQAQFDTFLEIMRQGCKKHLHRLIKSEFTLLLKSLIQHTCNRRKQFFGTLKAHTDAINRAFILIEERKIEIFSREMIENLVSGGEEVFEVMKQRPKIVAQRTSEELRSLADEILDINQQVDIDFASLDTNLKASEIPVFRALGITNMLPIQNLTYQLCTNFSVNEKRYLQYQTGQGKTALCLAIGCHLNQIGRRVFILNDSQELTFRDYKKSQQIQDSVGIQFIHRLHSYSPRMHNNAVCFCTFDDLMEFDSPEMKFDQKGTSFIIDEFDSILFEKKYPIGDVIKAFNKASQIIAFTGSLMQECHKIFIQSNLNGSHINMIPREQFRMEAACKREVLYGTKKEMKEAILKECLETSLLVPIVLVCQDMAAEVYKTLKQKGLPIEAFFESQVAVTDGAMATFIMRRQDRYAIYLVNHQQARGIDFPSSSEIETNGGVHVLIVGLPKFYLQLRQFIGRTARIGNKGTYTIFEIDSRAKNTSSDVYFKNKLEELKNNAIIDLSGNSLPSDNQTELICQEEVKETFLLPQKRSVDSSIGFEISLSSAKQLDLNEVDIQSVNISPSTFLINQESKQMSQTSIVDQLIPKQQDQQSKKREVKAAGKNENKSARQKAMDKSKLTEVDERYFYSYANKAIHEEMLKDEARVEAYRTALRGASFEKIVIDVGAGTGILSMMAMDHGAKCVYAIEMSDICKVADEQFQQRYDKKRMAIHQCLAEEFYLVDQKADLIVSEWMGYFLIFENMLPSVLAVRDRCLADGGQIIPSEASLYICGYTGDYYDPDLDSIEANKAGVSEAVIALLEEKNIITKCERMMTIDLRTVKNYTNDFRSVVQLSVLKGEQLSGLCSWFNCKLTPTSNLDTSPSSKPTHWKQTFFPLKNKIALKENDTIEVEVHARPQVVNHRALDITIRVRGAAISEEIIEEYKISQ